ncbi:MAG: DUF6519 domain-containing protein [Litoreibacter sp.]|uniref:DUF6519 domain-containing protein n=1 Tax=Litoreibacter sp. TaxID=1969459 RepID=UPI003298A1AF
MKGSHSRLSFQEAHRYSNVAHVQGAMITDADLTEAAQIHQDRDEAQGAAFAGSGIPAAGGMVTLQDDGRVQLSAGTVFAQGKQGHFRLNEKLSSTEQLPEVFAHQIDLPQGPNITKGLVYVDLWERPVMAYEAPYLADAGLHGAETSYRTQTMVQVKSLPDVNQLSELPKFFLHHPAFMPHGDARLSIQLAKAATEQDACDPCADQISIENLLPNALIRVEILSVERDKSGAATSLRLAWSSENAEAIEPIETRTLLQRSDAVYEYFSLATETQLGYFHNDHKPLRGAFSSDLQSETPSDPTLNAEEKLGYTHVRRWDGMVQVALNTRGRPAGPSAATAKPTVTTANITLDTEFFKLTLEHDDAQIIAGDYWLVDLRRYAPEDEQALLNGQPLGQPQPPLGITHHFCPIGFSDGETIQPLPDTLRRRMSFPTLTDIPATHVGYDANPECDLLGDTNNVQQALDRVCEIDATHVGFTPSDKDCESLGDAKSVDEALNALCKADNNKQLKLMLRTMMDWGVVCGLSVGLGNKGIEVSGGVALDRTGVLHEIRPETVLLEKFDEKQLLPDAETFKDLKGRNQEVCLSLGIRGDDQAYFLSPAYLVNDQNELTLDEQVNACLKGKGSLTQSELFASLSKNPKMVAVLTKLHVCLRNDIRPLPDMTFNGAEIKLANAFLEDLIKEYQNRLKATGDPLAKEKANDLREINEALDLELKNSGLNGSSDQLTLVSSTLKYAAIMKKDEEFRLDCLCANVVPDCPAQEEGWTLVPLACVDMVSFDPGRLSAKDISMMWCRKQANTPRSHRYYNGDMVGQILSGFKELCSEEQLRNDNGPSSRLRRWLREAGQAPWDPPQSTPYWPAKPTYGGAAMYGSSTGTGFSVLNTWQRADNPTILNVTGMTSQDAQEHLKGAGFDLLEVLSTSNIGQLVELAGNAPLLNRRPQAGDGVVLIVDQNEKESRAVEFIVIKQKTNFFDLKKFGAQIADGLKNIAEPQKEISLKDIKITPQDVKQPDPKPAKNPPKGKDIGKTQTDLVKDRPKTEILEVKKTLERKDIKSALDTRPIKKIPLKVEPKPNPKIKADQVGKRDKTTNTAKKNGETAAAKKIGKVSLGTKGRGSRRKPKR